MEQLIAFIIIYIIYTLFSMMQKRKRDQAGPRRTESRPTAPDRRTPPRRQPDEEVPEEPEIPEFLRRMLGLPPEEAPVPPPPRPVPTLKPEVVEPETLEEEESVEADTDLSPAAEGGYEQASLVDVVREEKARKTAEEALAASLRKPTSPSPGRAMLVAELRTKNNLQKAVLLREILDKPVSMRRKQFPISR